MVETRQPDGMPSFVEQLDAVDLARTSGFKLPPVMIYGDDVTHVITEIGVADLLLCRSAEERTAALRAIAGDTDFGRAIWAETTADLRRRGVVMLPADLGIDPHTATRDLLAAQSIGDLVRSSGGLYEPPARFRWGGVRPATRSKVMPASTSQIPSLPWHDRGWASIAPGGRPDEETSLDRVKRLAAALLSERGEASGAIIARELHDRLRSLDA